MTGHQRSIAAARYTPNGCLVCLPLATRHVIAMIALRAARVIDNVKFIYGFLYAVCVSVSRVSILRIYA